MSELLSSIVGKQNDFATRFMGGGSTTSFPLTLTPPSGQRVRLTHLSTAAGLFIGDMSVKFDSTIIYTGSIYGSLPDNGTAFSVGNYQPYAAGLPPRNNYEFWTGATDEVFTLVKNGIDPINTVYYGYEFGE